MLIPEVLVSRCSTEGKLAAKIVAKGEGVASWQTIGSFREAQEALKLRSPGALLPAIEKHLKPGVSSMLSCLI